MNLVDPRHLARQNIVQKLFAFSFRKEKTGRGIVNKIVKSLNEIDQILAKSATERPLSDIAKTDLAILRLAVFELLYHPSKAPDKVIINEAVELAHEFGGERSPFFINGALGKILKDVRKTEKNHR